MHAFLSSADFFSKSTFLKKNFRNTVRVSNSLDPDQARLFVGPDLVPNCLQKLSADETSRQKVNVSFMCLLPISVLQRETTPELSSTGEHYNS